jgi:hypothetical protein
MLLPPNSETRLSMIKSSATGMIVGGLFAMAVWTLCSCAPNATVSNRNVTRPVMLGPVHRVASPPEATPDAAEGSTLKITSASTKMSLSTGTYTEKEALFWPDVAVIQAGLKCRECEMTVSRIRVGSFTSHLLLMIPFYSQNRATMKIVVKDPGESTGSER